MGFAVAAGLVYNTPLLYINGNTIKYFKIDIGGNLNSNDVIFFIYEPNSRKHLFYTISKDHDYKIIIMSKSEGFNRDADIYIKEGDISTFYIRVIQWSKILLFPGTIYDKKIWNPTITDVTESFDPSQLIKIW